MAERATQGLACWAFLLILLVTPGCGGKTRTTHIPGDPAPATGIPFPPERSAAGLTEYVLHGATAEERSAGAVDSGTALVLAAEVGGFEYALYRFNAPGLGSAGELDSVSVLLEDGVTTEAWIGIADYETGSWSFDGPFTKPKTLALDDPRYVSPGGDAWVAVLVAAAQNATVNALSVRTINPANQPPIAAVDALPLSGDAPLLVQFNASGSTDPDSPIIEYAWDFDGNETYEEFTDTPFASHLYQTPGIRLVRMRVTDNQFARSFATVEISVNAPGNDFPVAHFSRTPVAGNAPLFVEFDAVLSSDPDGSIVRYDWDFEGDGTWDAYDSGPQVSHTYTSPGAFLPKLRVTDNLGAQATDQRTLNVNIEGNDPPVANFTRTPAAGHAPLFVTFNASTSFDPDGNIVKYEWDYEGDGVWDAYSESPTTSHTYASGAAYLPKLRITDNVGAQAEQTRTMNVNDPPVAQLSKSNVGEVVHLDASGSTDAEGNIVDFEWDLDGDGVFDDTAEELAYAGSPLAQVTPGPAPGYYLVQVRVTDDKGAQNTAELTLTVLGWFTLPVDTGGVVGEYTSLAVVNGKPAISYHDASNGHLKYAYSSSVDGRSGWTAIAVDTVGLVGQFTSLAVVNGKPAISYYHWSNTDLKYAYSFAADGSSGWTALLVDSVGNVGENTSLAVVNGKPAISYSDGTNGDLKYAYSSTEDGSSGWTTIAVDEPGLVGYYSSLAVINGKPAISYYDATSNDLKYAYSSTVDGSSGWSALAVDTPGVVGFYTSLAVVNGKPAISYYDNTNFDLKYAYSSAADGSSGWTAIAADTPGAVGLFTSLAVVNGKPAISYWDSTNEDLKYAYSSTAVGSNGWTATTVEATGSVGRSTSLAVLPTGQPAISYRDFTNEDLKYAVLYE